MTHKNPGVNSQVTMIWPQGLKKSLPVQAASGKPPETEFTASN